MQVRPDDPTRDQVLRLLREHLADVALHSPPESIHALDINALCSPNITFWTATDARTDALQSPKRKRGASPDDPEILGCGALLELDPRHGEIKSMRTAKEHLRKGVAAAILQHIIAEAQRRSYQRLSLETGAQPAFAPARALYAKHGFVPCPPFAHYRLDPNSVFMTREL